MANDYLGQLEEVILLAVWQLRGDGYGISLKDHIEEKTGRRISTGALYATLGRLEEKGFISSRDGESTAERGGRAKRYFKVEGAGLRIIADMHNMRQQLLAGADPSLIHALR